MAKCVWSFMDKSFGVIIPYSVLCPPDGASANLLKAIEANKNNIKLKMTTRQKLILFLINCEPGIKDIYKMVKIFDHADFPSNIDDTLNPLLEQGLIYVSKNLANGTPFVYEITEKGRMFLIQNFNDQEILEHVKKMQNPDLLLQITQTYLNKKNGF